jgi:hypothetical protein
VPRGPVSRSPYANVHQHSVLPKQWLELVLLRSGKRRALSVVWVMGTEGMLSVEAGLRHPWRWCARYSGEHGDRSPRGADVLSWGGVGPPTRPKGARKAVGRKLACVWRLRVRR